MTWPVILTLCYLLGLVGTLGCIAVAIAITPDEEFPPSSAKNMIVAYLLLISYLLFWPIFWIFVGIHSYKESKKYDQLPNTILPLSEKK